MVEERDYEIEHRGFHDRFPDMRALARRSRAGEGEDPSANDGPDAETRKVEDGEGALHPAISALRFPNQEFRAFGLKESGCHE